MDKIYVTMKPASKVYFGPSTIAYKLFTHSNYPVLGTTVGLSVCL